MRRPREYFTMRRILIGALVVFALVLVWRYLPTVTLPVPQTAVSTPVPEPPVPVQQTPPEPVAPETEQPAPEPAPPVATQLPHKNERPRQSSSPWYAPPSEASSSESGYRDLTADEIRRITVKRECEGYFHSRGIGVEGFGNDHWIFDPQTGQFHCEP
jgi:type IV secretory pathway VirB10-like protein